MGGGVSSLPAEVSLAEAKELAGARWQPAWEEKFAEAKISRDEAIPQAPSEGEPHEQETPLENCIAARKALLESMPTFRLKAAAKEAGVPPLPIGQPARTKDETIAIILDLEKANGSGVDDDAEAVAASTVDRVLEAGQVGRSELRFIAIGDWGDGGGAGSRSVAAGMAEWARKQNGVDFVLALGDNFYPHGASSKSDKCFDVHWANVFLAHEELRTPWWCILGNHDYMGNPAAQVGISSTEGRFRQLWHMPDRNYSFAYTLDDAQQTRIVFHGLDTNGCQGHVRGSYPEQEGALHGNVEELSQKLRSNFVSGEDVAPWQVVFGHHPIHTGGRRHSKIAECLREHSYLHRGEKTAGYGLGDVLLDGSVAMYLCGHEHVMQHKQYGCVAQCVSGAVSDTGFYGGIGESATEMDWWDESYSRGFLAVTIRSEEAVLEFMDATGATVVHTITITKPSAGPNHTEEGNPPEPQPHESYSTPRRRGAAVVR
jgi:hypothetical protein